jgi:hypothetical protein
LKDDQSVTTNCSVIAVVDCMYYIIICIRRSWLIPGPNPQRDSIEISLASVNHTSPDTRNYSFVATFPHNARVVLEPLDGLQLWSWSFDASIPPKTPYGDGKGCYYILYTRGTGNGKTHFWLEIKVTTTTSCLIAWQ